MANGNILLAYRDVITESTVQQLLEITEVRLAGQTGEKKVRKRVFNVLVECLQNVVNHGYECENGCSSIVLVIKGDDAYEVRTGNMIANDAIAHLQERLEEVNGLVGTDVRSTYSDKLTNAEFSEKGGAGLGLLDIYRKSGERIGHSIKRIDNEKSFLSISVRVRF